MKKNYFWSMLTMMVVTMLSVSLVSCHDDDDKKDGDSSSSIVGTWSGNYDGGQLTLTFKSGGTGTWIDRYYDSYSGMDTDRGSFTYEMESKSSGIIIVEYEDNYSGYDTDVIHFEINGKRMYLYEHEYDDENLAVLTKQ